VLHWRRILYYLWVLCSFNWNLTLCFALGATGIWEA
jgi:hypothetical protein